MSYSVHVNFFGFRAHDAVCVSLTNVNDFISFVLSDDSALNQDDIEVLSREGRVCYRDKCGVMVDVCRN